MAITGEKAIWLRMTSELGLYSGVVTVICERETFDKVIHCEQTYHISVNYY